MQKFYLILLSSLFAASTSVAGVRFIVENGESYYNDNWFEKSTTTISRCEQKATPSPNVIPAFIQPPLAPMTTVFIKNAALKNTATPKTNATPWARPQAAFPAVGFTAVTNFTITKKRDGRKTVPFIIKPSTI